jgi:hypothetical protein
LLSTLLIAVLPENIAQSRLGWEPCESVLIDLFIVYGSLAIVKGDTNPTRLLVGTAIASILALTIQATNAFACLFLPIAIGVRYRREAGAFLSTRNGRIWFGVALMAASVGLWAAKHVLRKPLGLIASLQHFPSRPFLLNYADLFSGRTTYSYVAGYPRPFHSIDFIDVISLIPWLLVAVLAARIIWSREKAKILDRFLAAAWLIEVAAFASIAGAVSLEPTISRFALCLIVPGVLILVRALEYSTSRWPAERCGAQFGVLAICAVLLASFFTCYFRYIMRTGGNSEMPFRTASTDPKLTAARYVLNRCPRNAPCYIVCSSYWNYYPTRYFSSDSPNVRVLMLGGVTSSEVASCRRAMQDGDFWTIDFLSERPQVRRVLALPGIEWEILAVPDYSGRPAIVIGHARLPAQVRQ